MVQYYQNGFCQIYTIVFYNIIDFNIQSECEKNICALTSITTTRKFNVNVFIISFCPNLWSSFFPCLALMSTYKVEPPTNWGFMLFILKSMYGFYPSSLHQNMTFMTTLSHTPTQSNRTHHLCQDSIIIIFLQSWKSHFGIMFRFVIW